MKHPNIRKTISRLFLNKPLEHHPVADLLFKVAALEVAVALAGRRLHVAATDLPQDVAIADMFSTSRIKNNYKADKAYRSASIYDIWRATFRLGNQSSFKTDSLVIIVNDPYNYDE